MTEHPLITEFQSALSSRVAHKTGASVAREAEARKALNDALTPPADAMREALAEKVRKDIACTRTYTMREWAVIEVALAAPVPPPDGAAEASSGAECKAIALGQHSERCVAWDAACSTIADALDVLKQGGPA